MTSTAAKPYSLWALTTLLLTSRVQAFGLFHARDDLIGPSGGHHGWPGNGHGQGHGHDHGHDHDNGDDDGDTACSCPQPVTITPSSTSGFETGVPVPTVTTTVTVPGPTITRLGNTVTVPASTITIPGTTVTIPGSIAPITQPVPETVIINLPAGPSISIPTSGGLLNEGLNGGSLGPSITAPAGSTWETPLVPTACGPQTVIETVFTTVTSTLAWPGH